jgi:hypothetical protein
LRDDVGVVGKLADTGEGMVLGEGGEAPDEVL